VVSEKIIQQIVKHESILIVADEVSSKDKALAIISLNDLFSRHNKKSDIVIVNRPSILIDKIFTDNEVRYADQIEPIKYVVRIDYSKTPIEKVSYDTNEKDGKISFYIIPKGKNFDFDNVEYNQVGSDYSLVLFFGQDIDISRIDKENRSLNRAKIIKFDRQITSQQSPQSNSQNISEIVNLKGNESYCSVITDISEQFDTKLDQSNAQRLLDGHLSYIGLLEGGVRFDADNIDVIKYLVSSGAVMVDAINNAYFAKNNQNMNIQKKLMHNVKYNTDGGVLWSVITNQEIIAENLDKDLIDTNGRIIFAISQDYPLNIAGYEIEPNNIKVIVQSNNIEKYSALKIAEAFGGKGNPHCASFTMQNIQPIDFENVLFAVLSQLYGISPDNNEGYPY